MKIYTRTGDRGDTGLFGGGRVSKDAARIEGYGSVDELNASLGLARAHVREHAPLARADALLTRVQSDLFVLGADLATPPEARTRPPRITDAHIATLEQDIDRLEADLPPLRNFILPGGGPAPAALHFARTIARRAERAVVRAARTETIAPQAITYLNRLSDFLFVLARWCAHTTGEPDEIWQAPE